ncbi:hypothetical protein [Bifidobacterium aquikefiricola]|jgi:hypothetical protein|uniref:Uncharacterized protein n=1 Tax=Bifidobacterium aquikefiricola TaxID=3059038 RepID=A0AB39U6S6_9BIFI
MDTGLARHVEYACFEKPGTRPASTTGMAGRPASGRSASRLTSGWIILGGRDSPSTDTPLPCGRISFSISNSRIRFNARPSSGMPDRPRSTSSTSCTHLPSEDFETPRSCLPCRPRHAVLTNATTSALNSSQYVIAIIGSFPAGPTYPTRPKDTQHYSKYEQERLGYWTPTME